MHRALVIAWFFSPLLVSAETGQVIDAFSGQPIANAKVTEKAGLLSVKTDEDGRFSLPASLPHGVRLVGAAKGFYNAGVNLGDEFLTIRLDPVIFDPNVDIAFIPPNECSACHPRQFEEWEASAMGHAGRNRWVYDLFNGSATPNGTNGFVYTRDSKHAKENPNSECAACHAPERWLQNPGAGLPKWDEIEESEIRGVSCVVCHSVADVDVTQSHLPGFLEQVVQMHQGDTVRFGVLGDVDFHAPGRMRASYQPQLKAELCSTCHQDSSDPHGNGSFDGPISEPTFQEWAQSPYADPNSPHFKTCVDCHTEASKAPRASRIGGEYVRPLGQVRTHRFEGTSARFLEDALELRVRAVIRNNFLDVFVEVENHGAGHHVPTGVTIRNVILLVDVLGPNGSLTFHEGPLLGAEAGVGKPEAGYWAGLPGKLFAKINEDEHGRGPTLFTEAITIRSDTRIPALAIDRSVFIFEIPNDVADLRVEAKLVYRRAWRALVDQKAWKTDGHGNELADIKSPHFGHLMEEQILNVEVPRARKETSCSTTRGLSGFLIFGLVMLMVVRSRSPGSSR